MSRTSLLLGPTFRLTGADASLTADLDAFVAGSRLVVRGSGFPRPAASAGLDGGGGANLRVGLRRDWSPFLELGATAWPVARVGREEVDGNTRPLPRVEVGLTCGILFSAARGRVRSAALGPQN